MPRDSQDEKRLGEMRVTANTVLIWLSIVACAVGQFKSCVDEASNLKVNAQNIAELRVAVASLEADRLQAARLDERLAAFQREMARVSDEVKAGFAEMRARKR